MVYNVYQDDEKIATTNDKEFLVEGLTPNTEYSFSVSEQIGDVESEKSESVTITTKHSDVESVVVSPKTNNLEVGATRKLNASVEPSTAKQDVIFESSDDAVATVSFSGEVEAIAEGEATITVTAEDKSDTATVNVVEPPEVTTEEVTEEIDTVE